MQGTKLLTSCIAAGTNIKRWPVNDTSSFVHTNLNNVGFFASNGRDDKCLSNPASSMYKACASFHYSNQHLDLHLLLYSIDKALLE